MELHPRMLDCQTQSNLMLCFPPKTGHRYPNEWHRRPVVPPCMGAHRRYCLVWWIELQTLEEILWTTSLARSVGPRVLRFSHSGGAQSVPGMRPHRPQQSAAASTHLRLASPASIKAFMRDEGSAGRSKRPRGNAAILRPRVATATTLPHPPKCRSCLPPDTPPDSGVPSLFAGGSTRRLNDPWLSHSVHVPTSPRPLATPARTSRALPGHSDKLRRLFTSGPSLAPRIERKHPNGLPRLLLLVSCLAFFRASRNVLISGPSSSPVVSTAACKRATMAWAAGETSAGLRRAACRTVGWLLTLGTVAEGFPTSFPLR